MSKLSFRARALDATKPMPIYHKDELSDLQDYSILNRAVPQMPSGMEKEEESEHHLQRAISAQQVYGDTKVMVIPVPEAEVSLACYNNLYKKAFRLPKHYVHNQAAQALNSILEQEKPDYDMDNEDEKWVKDSKMRVGIDILPDQFEEMIDRLEKSCGKQIVTLQEAKLLLKEDDDLIKAVYDYWTKKRLHNKGPLMLHVRQERRDGSSSNDCYVAFRRRTEKMQTRKNRKNDESSYERMLKLRRELSRAVTILEMIKRREKNKRELLHLTLEVFEKRYQIKDWDGKCLRAVKKELHSHKARTHFRSLTSSAAQYRKKRLANAVVNKTKPILNNAPSISRGELNRDDLSKKLKKKRQRLHLPVGGAASSSYSLQTSKSVNDWLNTSNKMSSSRHPMSSSSSKSPSMSYQDVVETMTQYEFPPSDNEESISPLSTCLPTDGFDPKKHPDGVFTFRRKPRCSYYASRDDLVNDNPWHGTNSSRYRYSLTSLSVPDKCIGFVRRRVGRGGRVLLDRAYHPYSRQLEQLDLKKEHKHLPAKPEVQDLLSDIKKNRWRHYEASKHIPNAVFETEGIKHDGPPAPTKTPHFDYIKSLSFPDAERTSHHRRTSHSKQRKSTVRHSKKTQPNISAELSKNSVAFAMSALVTVATSTPVTMTTTTNCTKLPRTMSSVSHCKVLSSVARSQTSAKCVTCGNSISFTSSATDSRSSIGSSTAGTTSTHHRVVPLALSLATTQHQSTAQRTTVLPATVNVSMTRAGGGSHTAGVPALLRISSSGAVVGGTVLYPQPQAAFIKTEDASAKSKKDMVAMASISSSGVASQVRRTLTQRTPRGPVNVNLALPANVLASINSDSSALRASHSAPNSPRSHQAHSIDGGGTAKSTGQTAGNQKTISLNLMNASQGSLLVPTSYATTGQVVNAGRLISGNMLKLGNTLLHVALPQTTRQSSATSSGAPTSASENTLLVSDGNLILTTMDENKQKRTRAVAEQLNLKPELRPMTLTTLNSSSKRASLATVTDVPTNHTTQISHSSTTSNTESREPTTIEPLSSVTTNTVSVKSSKSSRPMEVT